MVDELIDAKPPKKAKPDQPDQNLPAEKPAELIPDAGGPFQSASQAMGMDEQMAAAAQSGLSYTPNLQEVPDSKVPFAEHSHVFGPQQAACDPVAAGLDTSYAGLSRSENRVINRTGEAASGPRTLLLDHPAADGSLVRAPSDEDAAKVAGPTSASQPAG